MTRRLDRPAAMAIAIILAADLLALVLIGRGLAYLARVVADALLGGGP